MAAPYEDLLSKMYNAFNERDVDTVLQYMHEDVAWPNGWEGGYVHGHEAVRDYWTRQWAVLNPRVSPIAFTQLEDGRIETRVRQTVKDITGKPMFDGLVKHIYTIKEGIITTMEIVEV